MKKILLAVLIGLVCVSAATAWTFRVVVMVEGDATYTVEINTLPAKNVDGEIVSTGGKYFYLSMPSDPRVACKCAVKVKTVDGQECPMSIKIYATEERNDDITGIVESGVTGRELYLVMDHPRWLDLINRGY